MPPDAELVEKYTDDPELVDQLHYLDSVESEKGLESDDFVATLAETGRLFHERGNFLDALGYLIRARAVLEAREEQLHPLMSNILAGIGENYLLQGMYQEALPYYEKAVSVREALCIAENEDTARLLMKAGEIQVMQGELFPAHEHLTRAYQILCNACPENFEALGDACHNLGILLLSEKQFDRSVEALRKAAQHREQWFGKSSLERADSLVAFAAASAELKRGALALEALYEAVTIREEILGSDHEAVRDAKERYRDLSNRVDDPGEAPERPRAKPEAVHSDAEMVMALISTAVLAVEREHREIALELLELSKRALGGDPELPEEILSKIAEIIRERR